MPSKWKPKLPPVPTWTCPHCGHVHTPTTLMRVDGEHLKCAACGKKFSVVESQSQNQP
jgi:transcription elongation factor Elf1